MCPPKCIRVRLKLHGITAISIPIECVEFVGSLLFFFYVLFKYNRCVFAVLFQLIPHLKFNFCFCLYACHFNWVPRLRLKAFIIFIYVQKSKKDAFVHTQQKKHKKTVSFRRVCVFIFTHHWSRSNSWKLNACFVFSPLATSAKIRTQKITGQKKKTNSYVSGCCAKHSNPFIYFSSVVSRARARVLFFGRSFTSRVILFARALYFFDFLFMFC